MQNNPSTSHQILLQRLSSIPSLIPLTLNHLNSQPLSTISPSPSYIITGIGSSEAHAKFLSTLLNHFHLAHASFLPIASFLNPSFTPHPNSTLILFSQGLSPNAQIPLHHASKFSHIILFTSIHPNLPEEQYANKRSLLSQFQTLPNLSLITVPPLDYEGSTLIRLQGPFSYFLASLYFLQKVHNLPLPLSSLSLQLPQPSSLPPSTASTLLITDPLPSLYSQNLAYKFLEGLFFPLPLITDPLSLAHGPLQQASLPPQPTAIILSSPSSDPQLLTLTQKTLHAASIPSISIHSDLPFPLDILSHELSLSSLVTHSLITRNINQINWPSKNLDTLLYSIHSPSSSLP